MNEYKGEYIFKRIVIPVSIIIGILFSFHVLNIFILRPLQKEKIKNAITLANAAEITKITHINKNSASNIYYQFKVDNKIYFQKNVISLDLRRYGIDYLFEKKLPVAYEYGNPENSFILIRPKDFEYFKVPFPDSLKWIKTDVLDDGSN